MRDQTPLHGRRARAAQLPKYVEELRNLCTRYGIPCVLDEGARRATLTLNSSDADQPRGLSSVIADVRANTSWTVDY